jgi:hypothetical protein
MAVAGILLEYGADASAPGDDGSILLHQALSKVMWTSQNPF